MLIGEDRVREAAEYITPIDEIVFREDNIMGVKIPKIEIDNLRLPEKPTYPLMESCAKLDEAQQQLVNILRKLIELADLEGGIQGLALEIEKTKRRVNVLENTLIPKLKATQRYIEMQLEELEREDFFRRKRIKAIMESKEQ